MTVEDSSKKDILGGLRKSLSCAGAMQVELMLLGKQAEANKCAKSAKNLSRRIDKAMDGFIDEWVQQAPSINEDIAVLSDKILEATKQLEADVYNTTQIVDAISYIDDLTSIARRLFRD